MSDRKSWSNREWRFAHMRDIAESLPPVPPGTGSPVELLSVLEVSAEELKKTDPTSPEDLVRFAVAVVTMIQNWTHEHMKSVSGADVPKWLQKLNDVKRRLHQ